MYGLSESLVSFDLWPVCQGQMQDQSWLEKLTFSICHFFSTEEILGFEWSLQEILC